MQAMQEMEKHVGKSNAYLEIEERYKQAKYYAEEMKKEEEEEQTAVLTADMKTNPSVKYLTNIVHMGEVQAETVPQEIGTKEAAQGQSDYVRRRAVRTEMSSSLMRMRTSSAWTAGGSQERPMDLTCRWRPVRWVKSSSRAWVMATELCCT